MHDKKIRRRKKRHKEERFYSVVKYLLIAAILLFVILGGLLITQIRNNHNSEPAAAAITEQTDTAHVDDKSTELSNSDTKMEKKVLEVYYIDVGQGDAALLRMGEHAAMIDVGSSTEEEKLVDFLHGQNITKLDYLIFTHGHEDHTGNAENLMTNFEYVKELAGKINIKVNNVILDFDTDEGAAMRAKSVAEGLEIPIITPKRGDSFPLGDAEITILMERNTELEQSDNQVTNVNNQSLAIKVTYGENEFLFYGDGEKAYEDYLIENNIDIQADVLKVAHHGHESSNNREVLDIINPRFAVISSGLYMDTADKGTESGIKFPSDSVVSYFSARYIPTFYTNTCGTIKAESNGKELQWSISK